MNIQRILLLLCGAALLAPLAAGCGSKAPAMNDLEAQRKAVMGSPAPANVQAEVAKQAAAQRQAVQGHYQAPK